MEENNLQRTQEQAAGGQQPATGQMLPNQSWQAYGYGQQPAQNQTAGYGQQPVQNQAAYSYGQQPVQNQTTYSYGQQQVQNQTAYAYGQPAQSPYMYGAPAQQPGGGRKKKKGVWIAAVLALVCAAVLAVGVGAAMAASANRSPQTRLAKGLLHLAGEMQAGEAAIFADMDYPAIINMLRREGGSVDLSLNVTIPGEDTIGFDWVQQYDPVNRLISADAEISVFNVSLMQMNLAANEERLYFGMPGWLSDTYYVNAETLGRDYNASAWKDMMGMDALADDFALDLFPELQEQETGFDLDSVIEKIENLADGIAVEGGKDSKEFEINGKTVRCSGVRLTIEKELLNEFLEEIEQEAAMSGRKEYFSVRLAADAKLNFYLDDKDRIVAIETAEEMELEDSAVEGICFSLVFSGAERTLDETSGSLELISPDDTLYVQWEGEEELTKTEYSNALRVQFHDEAGEEVLMVCHAEWDLENKEFEAEVNISGEGDELVFEVKGGFEDIEKGKKAVFRLGQLKVVEDGEEICRLSGSFAMGPLTDHIEMPSEAVDLLGMERADILRVISEIYENIMNNPWDNPWGVSPL